MADMIKVYNDLIINNLYYKYHVIKEGSLLTVVKIVFRSKTWMFFKLLASQNVTPESRWDNNYQSIIFF